jgi:hypothetical protein
MLSLAVQRPNPNRGKYCFSLRSLYVDEPEIEVFSERPFVVVTDCSYHGTSVWCYADTLSQAKSIAKEVGDDFQFRDLAVRVVAGTLIR